MTEPITAITIATLAFQEFIKSGAGELAKKFTAEAIAKIGQLQELIWNRLREKHPAAEQALEQAQSGEQEGIDTIATLLGVEMLDKEFAGQVQAIVESIQKEALSGTSDIQLIQTVRGSQNQVIVQEFFGYMDGKAQQIFIDGGIIGDFTSGGTGSGGTGSGGTGSAGTGSGGTGSGESKRYLQSEVPDRVKLNSRFNLLVRVILESAENTNLLREFYVPVEGTNIKISVNSPGCAVISDATQKIFIPPDSNSDPLLFELEATQAGIQKIEILAFNDGAYLGSHFVQISVDSFIQTGPAIQQYGLISNRLADDGETTLTIKYDLDTKRYRYVLRSRSIGETDDMLSGPLSRPREELIKDFIETLNAIARGSVPMSSMAAKILLQGKGKNLWNELIPDSLKQIFWDHRDNIRQMRIICGQDPIPWEVLYPTYKDEAGSGFLAELFPVTRWRSGPPANNSFKMSRPLFVLPKDSPPQADKEISKLKAKLKNWRLIEQLDPLLDEFKSPQFNLLHFACHNMFKADKPDSSYINIGGSPFMIDMLASSGKSIKMRSPLVFMNACRTAGSAPTYTQLSGWADKFLDAGASAFIGSLWEIRDSSAPIFAENVYGSLLSGTTLGNSVLNARKAIQEETGDPTWLAYALYGDPNATLIQGE
jgi:hypothetical protein